MQKPFFWIRLYGVGDRSRAPENSPSKLDEATVIQLNKLRTAHPSWGQKNCSSLQKSPPHCNHAYEAHCKLYFPLHGAVQTAGSWFLHCEGWNREIVGIAILKMDWILLQMLLLFQQTLRSVICQFSSDAADSAVFSIDCWIFKMLAYLNSYWMVKGDIQTWRHCGTILNFDKIFWQYCTVDIYFLLL